MLASAEEEAKPPRPVRPLPSGPTPSIPNPPNSTPSNNTTTRVQQVASAFSNASVTPQGPTVFRISSATNLKESAPHPSKTTAPPLPKVKEAGAAGGSVGKQPLSPKSGSQSFFLPRHNNTIHSSQPATQSIPTHLLPNPQHNLIPNNNPHNNSNNGEGRVKNMGHTMSYGTLGLPRPKPTTSPPTPPSSRNNSHPKSDHTDTNDIEQDDYTTSNDIDTDTQNNEDEQLKKRTSNEMILEQMRELKERVTRQQLEIVVLKRELDDKYRIELELKTDLEAERSNKKNKEEVGNKISPRAKGPPPQIPPPPPIHLLNKDNNTIGNNNNSNTIGNNNSNTTGNNNSSSSGNNNSTSSNSDNSSKNMILELKATVSVLEKENLMIREDMDKKSSKGTEDAQTIKDLRGEVQAVRREMNSLRTQLESIPSIKKKSGGKRYEATFEFTPENEGDLTLNIGDIVELTEQENDSWWRGRNVNTNETGIFPSNFVKEVGVGISEEMVIDESTPARMVRAIYDYNSTAEDEISFKKGEMIELLVENDNGWWYGVNPQGLAGLFPSNFAVEDCS